MHGQPHIRFACLVWKWSFHHDTLNLVWWRKWVVLDITRWEICANNYPTKCNNIQFISANCSTCFVWYSTHHQELIPLYLQYLALLRLLLLPVVSVTFTTGGSNGFLMPVTVDTVIRAPVDAWSYHTKHVEQFADINKLYIVASCCIITDTCYGMHGPLNIKTMRNLVNITILSCDDSDV